MNLIDKLKDTVDGALDTAKATVNQNQDRIHHAIDTVTQAADERTGHKYSDRITKLADTAKSGVESVGADAPASAVADEPGVSDAEIVEER